MNKVTQKGDISRIVMHLPCTFFILSPRNIGIASDLGFYFSHIHLSPLQHL